MSSSIKFLGQKEAQELDAELMGEEYGFANAQLMELAGFACALATMKAYQNTKRACVLVGPGNNGGDGLVAARHLAHFGVACDLVFPKRKDVAHLKALTKQCVALEQPLLDELPSNLEDKYDVVVDGLFGFSFDPTNGIRGPFGAIIEQVNKTKLPVVAIDIPSGWHVEKGNEAGVGLRCDVLVSLTAPKKCAEHHKGKHYLGGRFVPPSLAKKYQLNLPDYPSTSIEIRGLL